MKIEVYSYRAAEKIIEDTLRSEILSSIESLDYVIAPGCANDLRKIILSRLREQGWSDEVTLDTRSNISLTSFRDGCVLCLQTGNMGRFYADLLKLQYVFLRNKASAAIYILPSKVASTTMGSNIANFDRFVNELKIFSEIITIPTLVIGLK